MEIKGGGQIDFLLKQFNDEQALCGVSLCETSEKERRG